MKVNCLVQDLTLKTMIKISQVGRHSVIFRVSTITVVIHWKRDPPERAPYLSTSCAFYRPWKCGPHLVHNLLLVKLTHPFSFHTKGFVNVVLAAGTLNKETSYHRSWARETCQTDFLNETHTHFPWQMSPGLSKMKSVACVGCVYFCAVFRKQPWMDSTAFPLRASNLKIAHRFWLMGKQITTKWNLHYHEYCSVSALVSWPRCLLYVIS